MKTYDVIDGNTCVDFDGEILSLNEIFERLKALEIKKEPNKKENLHGMAKELDDLGISL